MCAHVWTRDQVNNCGIDGGLALPESSPVLSIISGTSVCLHLTPLHFGAVTGTPTILVITPLHFGAVTGTPTILVITPLHFGAVTGTPTILVITPLHFGAVVDNGRTKETDFNPTRIQSAPHDIVAECH